MQPSNIILLSGEQALQKSLDVIANNVANASTVGFKRENISFNTILSQVPNNTKPLQLIGNGATYRDTSNGAITKTGNDLDLAISGKGYFEVQRADGTTAYTRAGSFQLDNQGQLVTHSGEPVLSQSGQPILVPSTTSQINISGDGSVSGRVDNGNALAQLGQIAVVKFDNEQGLQPVGNGAYTTNQAAQPSTDGSIVQGAVEQSNVNPIAEMTSMIEVSRSYQQIINLISSERDRSQQAVERLSKTTI